MTSRAGRPGRLVTAALTTGVFGSGLGVSLGLGMLSGCYQGEWRLGVEVPVAMTTRLLPVRSVESWELSHTQTPYVVQVKGTSTPRCRHAQYGKAKRVDTGKFERVGGGYWKTLAIGFGAIGGAAAGFGGAGWATSILPSSYGPPILYGVGGAMVLGGLVSCFSALARPAKLRYAMCGILTGLGASVVGGALVGSLTQPGSVTTMSPMGMPLIPSSTMQTLMLAGGGLVGGSIVTGLVANIWDGYDDRVRTVELNNQTLWDPQQSETTCGDVTPLHGRTVGLDIVAERATAGLGSDEVPIKLRVALGSQSTQPVDLRGLRQALSSCGALRVQLSPDVVYEEYTEDYTPPVTPDQMNLSAQPVFGRIEPKEGIVLSGTEGRHRPVVNKSAFFHGVSADLLANVDRYCRGDGPPVVTGKRPPPVINGPKLAKHPGLRPPPAPEGTAEPTEPPQMAENAANGPPEAPPPPPPSALPPEDVFVSTPGTTLPQTGLGDEGECSLSAARSRFNDCESQCARAWSMSTALLDFRKCYLDSRGSMQVQHDRDQCNLTWEQGLLRTNVSPASWRRCVEGCAESNVPYSCQKAADRRYNGP